MPQVCSLTVQRQRYNAHLQVDIRDVFPDGDARGAVDDLHPDGRLALGLEHVVDQVLGREVDIAPPVRVVLAQHALGVQATQAPAEGGAQMYQLSENAADSQQCVFQRIVSP